MITYRSDPSLFSFTYEYCSTPFPSYPFSELCEDPVGEAMRPSLRTCTPVAMFIVVSVVFKEMGAESVEIYYSSNYLGNGKIVAARCMEYFFFFPLK